MKRPLKDFDPLLTVTAKRSSKYRRKAGLCTGRAETGLRQESLKTQSFMWKKKAF